MTTFAAALLFLMPPQASDGPPQALAYEVSAPFGGYQAIWRFDASGHGEYRFVGPERGQSREGDLDIGPAGFARLQATLAPLEGGTALSCRETVTDGPYIHDAEGGALSWTRREQITVRHLDFGCVSQAGRTDAARLREAEGMVRRWADEAQR